jgi:hypothetical protein
MRQTTESVPGFPPDVAMPVTGASKSPALGIDPPGEPSGHARTSPDLLGHVERQCYWQSAGSHISTDSAAVLDVLVAVVLPHECFLAHHLPVKQPDPGGEVDQRNPIGEH